MSNKISEKVKEFIYKANEETSKVIADINSDVAQDSIGIEMVLDEGLGERYFYKTVERIIKVIESFEEEEKIWTLK